MYFLIYIDFKGDFGDYYLGIFNIKSVKAK